MAHRGPSNAPVEENGDGGAACASTIQSPPKHKTAHKGRFALTLLAVTALCRLEVRSCLLAALGDDVEADALAFNQRAEPRAFNGADVHEHVLRPTLGLDETKAFAGVKPFNGTDSHYGLQNKSRTQLGCGSEQSERGECLGRDCPGPGRQLKAGQNVDCGHIVRATGWEVKENIWTGLILE